MVLWLASFILYWEGLPEPFPIPKGHPLGISVEFHYITGTSDTQAGRENAQIPQNNEVPSGFCGCRIVGLFVKNTSLRCPDVFLPLLLQVNERPLSGAKGKVLQAGQGKPILFGVGHPIRVQLTPSGTSPTVTV